MADPNLPLAPDLPPIETHRSGQYEFNDEQNRQISGLVDAMRVCAGLMQLMGLAFVVLCVMSALASRQSGSYGPAVGLGAGALLCLSIGFWTGSAATSFRRVVETKNEDIWHLMNALGKLQNMYGLLRTIILGSLVLAVVALALIAIALGTG
jgi:hypothetical protein